VRRALALPVLLALVMSLFGGASAVLAVDPDRPARPAPSEVEDLRLDQPIGTSAPRPTVLDASLLSATGTRQVVVRLSADSVGDVAAAGGSPTAQRQALGAVTTQQDQFLNRFNENVVARLEVATNAVILEVDASSLAALAADPAVERITPVIDYTLALDETVPYIGATDVQNAGFDGTGITVAVLDSGIDYTHAAFGDLATVHDYDAAYGADTTAPENRDQPDWTLISSHTNIVGGFDYVGEVWPDGRLAPDPDPIDCGGKTIGAGPALCAGGHGTHVADIIGGLAGVAPGVELHGVKVCSAVSTSCSGVALLLGMDYALDPNADGNTDDHVDVINMSLGSDYGQAFDDDLSLAVEVATEIGVLTVASAGNGSDKPYVSGTPAATPSALSVAQTAVPSSTLTFLEVITPEALAGSYLALHQPWSGDLTVAIQEPLYFDDGTNGTRLGCRLTGDNPATPDVNQPNPFEGTDLSGFVVLVDRGACTISEKVANIALAGGEAAVVGMVDGSAPTVFGLGDCPEDACNDIPGFNIALSISGPLQDAVLDGGAEVRLDPAAGLPLVGTMVGSSSRGPTMLTNRIKPEIGAPGASVSAEAGTATGTTPFSGTSGAAPMVTGAAALLMDGLSGDPRSPAEIKSLLMNYATTEIYNGAPDAPVNAPLAAIQRIGAGEVQVANSLDGADFAAWDSELQTGALSFGFVDSWEAVTSLTREVTVANYSGAEQTLDITPSFRFQDDIDNGAVDVSAPAQVTVPAGGTATFDVTLNIDSAALRAWNANSGSAGASPGPFNTLEYDGFVELSGEGVDTLHLAWHVLPRQSGATTPAAEEVAIDGQAFGFPAGTTTLDNDGAGDTQIEGYSLIGESSQLPTGAEGAGLPTIDLRYAGVQTIPVTDFCVAGESFLLLLAVNTWERQTHANAPAAFEWDIDTDGDGDHDFFVFNFELAGNLSDGRNVVIAGPIGSPGTPVFFTDHATNSGNTVLTICAEDIGLSAADIGQPLTADLFAVDIYFTGRVTDQILGMEFAPLGERYFPVVGDAGFGAGTVPAGGSETLTILDFGETGTNPSETGVLLFTDGSLPGSVKTGAPQDLEALILRPEGVEPEPEPEPDPGIPFEDIANPFINDIIWAYENGITGGCSVDPPLFCPNNPVLRDQMASFLDRTLGLPATSVDFFTDDEGNIHEGAINRLAAAGITGGCAADRYCPSSSVRRDQMASFLVRAFELPPSSTNFFNDDNSNLHENDINALAASGITGGCGPGRYCPSQVVTRAQMTAFLHRAVGD
jgi:minor extracellular serine protease Vpr